MAINTWSSAGSTDGNLVTNWSLGALAGTDTLTFDATSAINCTFTGAVTCAAIDVAAAYLGNFNQGGQTITSSGTVSLDSSGTNVLDAAITITGDGNFHCANSSLTMTADLTMQGDGDFDWDQNAVHTYGNFVFGSAGKTITFTGSAAMIMNDNTLTVAHSTGVLAGVVDLVITSATETTPLVTNGSTWVCADGSEIDWRPSAAMTVVVPEINDSSGELQLELRPYHTSGTIKFDVQGDITCGRMICNTQNYFDAEFDFNNHTISINEQNIYFHNNGTADTTVTCGSATFVLADGVDLNIATSSGDPVLFNCGTSDWTIGGNTTISQYTTFDEGTATWTLNGSGAQTITVSSNALGAITLANTGGIVQLQDAFDIASMDANDGAFDANGQTITCTGNWLCDTDDDHTIDGSFIMTGDGTFRMEGAGDKYLTAMVLDLRGDTTIQGSFATDRLLFTAAKTYTFEVTKSVTVGSYTPSDWDGTAGNLVTLVCSSPSTATTLTLGAAATVTYMDVTDMDNTAGTTINATSDTNVDGGNNTNWDGFTGGGGGVHHTHKSTKQYRVYHRKFKRINRINRK